MINMISIQTSDINLDQICRINNGYDGGLYTLTILFTNGEPQTFNYPTREERGNDRCRILGLPIPPGPSLEDSTPEPTAPSPTTGSPNTNNEPKSESNPSPTQSSKWQ